MCGIGGVVMRSGSPERAGLLRMAAAMRHRGPDGSNVTVIDNVGLAHTRLAIVGLGAEGAQPMRHAAGIWLNFNGEIFEHAAFRERLPPRAYRGGSDSETLLHALATHGVEALPRLNGFFGLAMLDPRRRRLLLARDRLGVKPLYWARQAGSLFFASELKGLFAAGVSVEPDLEVLRFFTAWTWAQGRRTAFAGVERLLPGRYLDIDLDSLEAREGSWYRLADSVDAAYAAELATLDRSDARQALADTLRRAVLRRWVADVPVATLCSGGVDSSLVTAIAAQSQPGLAAYVAEVRDQPERNEAPWAEKVCQHVGAKLRVVPIGPAVWRRQFIASALHFEYPLWHESSIALAEIAETARADGVKVLLGGEGADELLGGYDYKHVRERRAFARAASMPEPTLPSSSQLWVSDTSLASLFDVPPSLSSDNELRVQLRAELRAAYDHHEAPRAELETALAAELHLFLTPALCRTDKNVMQFGVEYREPYLDHDLLRLGLNLPLEQRVAPTTKALLREAAAAYLPEDVLARPKLGFSFDSYPYFSTMRSEFLQQSRLPDVLAIPRQLWTEGATAARGRTLFRMLAVETWYRLFIEGSSTAEVTLALWG